MVVVAGEWWRHMTRCKQWCKVGTCVGVGKEVARVLEEGVGVLEKSEMMESMGNTESYLEPCPINFLEHTFKF